MNTSPRHLCIIPARLLSSRLPGKPLKLLLKDSLVKTTWSQAKQAGIFETIVIATDDNTLCSNVEAFGATSIFTAAERTSGTERAAEAYEIARERYGDFTTVTVLPISLPTVSQAVFQRLIDESMNTPELACVTPLAPILSVEEFLDVHVVKATTNKSGTLLGISRAPIPYSISGYSEAPSIHVPLGWRLLSLATYRTDAFASYLHLTCPMEEAREEIDILRALHAGWSCRGFVLDLSQANRIVEVFTSSDLERVRNFLQKEGHQQQ
jgi:3-deoxy-manno-octulosonate cytidylyltransferase (CMP-KDO synthetase)